MKRFLNTSIIDFSNPVVSVRATGAKLGLEFPLSVKKMLSYHDISKTRTYGVCVLQYGGLARGTTLDADWLGRVFSDMRGIARYFRKMSGGRQFIEWEIFIPNQDVMPIGIKNGLAAKVKSESKTNPDATWIEIGPTRDAARTFVPVDNFPSWIWIIDDLVSTAGVTAQPGHPRDIFVGARDLRPHTVCHEMGHTLGLPHASTEVNEYGDFRCIMGDGRTFENTEIVPTKWSISGDSEPDLRYHSQSGPGICAPYLNRLGWLVMPNFIVIEKTAEGDLSGPLEGTLFANQGGPPVGSDRIIAIKISRSFSAPDVPDPLEYWIEYRIPERFDRGFRIFGPQDGYITLRKISPPVNGRSFLINDVPALRGQIIHLPGLDTILRVIEVDVSNEKISYSIEAHSG